MDYALWQCRTTYKETTTSAPQTPHKPPKLNLDTNTTQVGITNCTSFHRLVGVAKALSHYNPYIMVDVLQPYIMTHQHEFILSLSV